VAIGKDGVVNDVAFHSGPRDLAQAAIDVVKAWTYKPTLLNGEPVEVATSVTVNFSRPWFHGSST
jgi:outer membrane biosynthesis protein TonB